MLGTPITCLDPANLSQQHLVRTQRTAAKGLWLAARSASLGGLLCLLGWACQDSQPDAGGSENAALAHSVVLVTIDTLRADRLESYGAEAGSSPNFAKLAARGRLFEHAYSQATHTHPGLTSILTGFLPPRHKVETQGHRLAKGVRPLQLDLQGAGIHTGSFVANLCKLQDIERTVFHDGWDEMFCGMDMEQPHYLWDEAVVSEALTWIAQQDEPFFAWIHLMDPHLEHQPDPRFWDSAKNPLPDNQFELLREWETKRELPPAEFLERLNATYAAEVRGADGQLGRVMAAVEAHPKGDQIAMIVSADHGEELFETWARFGHGLSMTEGVLRVPLCVVAPGLVPERVVDSVETLRITPTVFQLLGLRGTTRYDGRSLLEETPTGAAALSFCGDVVSMRRGDLRLWMQTDLLERPSSLDTWFEDYYNQAPWFASDWALAEFGAEAPAQPVWQTLPEDEQASLADGFRELLQSRLGAAGGRGGGEELTDAEFLKQLEELGYL